MVPNSCRLSNPFWSSVAKTMTSASIRPTFSAEISACEPSGAYSSKPVVIVNPSSVRKSVLSPGG